MSADTNLSQSLRLTRSILSFSITVSVNSVLPPHQLTLSSLDLVSCSDASWFRCSSLFHYSLLLILSSSSPHPLLPSPPPPPPLPASPTTYHISAPTNSIPPTPPHHRGILSQKGGREALHMYRSVPGGGRVKRGMRKLLRMRGMKVTHGDEGIMEGADGL
eukprot:612276-Hanusia_phi.AAC.4